MIYDKIGSDYYLPETQEKIYVTILFSSHSVHLSNKVSTEKRKLAKFNLLYSTLLSDLQRDLIE